MKTSLHQELEALLCFLRGRRGFDPERYVQAKVSLLNSYLERSGLKSVVIGVSGGVDSALVLALIARAAKEKDSPIKRYVAALLPYFISEGTTNQEDATARGREVAHAFGAECVVVDLSSSHAAMKSVVDQSIGITGNAWASGQLVSYLRTPAFFYLTSLLSQTGVPSVFVGTTNRDEGGYIGYFGKAADAMVDLQLISDLHKSEVYAVSRLLGVPKSVLDAAPTGDIYDGRDDEHLIGAPYDFIELFVLYLTLLQEWQQASLIAELGTEARAQWEYFSARLRKLNAENTHKYLGGSPAVHLDVYERAVPGGWRLETYDAGVLQAAKPSASAFVNQFALDTALIDGLAVPRPNLSQGAAAPDPSVKHVALEGFGQSAMILQNVMSACESEALVTELAKQEWTPVGRNGMLKGFNPDTDVVGSYRATVYSQAFADRLWQRIAPHFPRLRLMDQYTPTDSDSTPAWRAVGISPVMRFIRYTEDGLLVPHYDAPYVYDQSRRTLMSVVLYLTQGAADDGGATRFILDGQRHLPLALRDLSDWSGEAAARDVLRAVSPELGSALIFDHRVLHDSQKISAGAHKIIMRTDVIFERCGLPPAKSLVASRPLGMPEEASRVSSVDAGSGAISTLAGDKEQDLLAKAMRDPFYGSAFPQLGSLAALEDAGFFDDGSAPLNEQPRFDGLGEDWLSTPVHKILSRLKALSSEQLSGDQSLAVLITTGAFCPVHQGHVQMMESAKLAAEADGMIVLGGYLSPSHDRYVSSKCGVGTLKAPQRLRLCEEALKESDWLMADGWESLAVDHDLNFTDVVARMERYLSRHIRTHKPIKVVYVCGGDNARFSRAFLGRGHCVCVFRPGTEEAFERYSALPAVARRKEIVFSRISGCDISSSQIRAGQTDALMSEGGRRLYLQWRQKKEGETAGRSVYYLRNEGPWALAPWRPGRNRQELSQAWRSFVQGLAALIELLHRADHEREPRFDVSCRILDLSKQRGVARQLIGRQPAISLDPCIKGEVNLAVSRRFALSAGRSLPGLGARPGSPSLEEQVRTIKPGEYVLFDDDIATGFSMTRVKELLPPEVRIKRTLALTTRETLGEGPDQIGVMDILDVRDFLAGAREGGLVVQLADGSLARAPYTLPYVSPADRVSTPLTSEGEFSLAVWSLNLAFFEKISRRPLVLAETNAAFQKLMLYIGFKPETAMTEICRWHIESLKAAQGLK